MVMSWKQFCDTPIKLFINSVTEQLPTETLIGVQLIDFVNRGTSLGWAVMNGDSDWDWVKFYF